MILYITGIGIVAPGLTDWEEASAVLRGDRPYTRIPLGRLSPAILPPNERRRATMPTRLALEASRQVLEVSKTDPEQLSSVFASSDGDLALVDAMCTSICREPPSVSPTIFHNSVHNAVAGYWSIAFGCMAASTSIAAWDGTFAAGLVESAAQLATDANELLLVAYDVPVSGKLDSHRHFCAPFACALALSNTDMTAPIASLQISIESAVQDTALPSELGTALDSLRLGNPAARSLSLFHAIATRRHGQLYLPYLADTSLCIRVN